MKNATLRKINMYNFNSLSLLYALIPIIALTVLKDVEEYIESHMRCYFMCLTWYNLLLCSQLLSSHTGNNKHEQGNVMILQTVCYCNLRDCALK